MEAIALKIFIRGVNEFNIKNYYDSHEYFEDIWTNHTLDDRLFIQALIQLSVAYFHISNDNKNGAISLFKKTIKKLDNYIDSNGLILNINEIVQFIFSSHKTKQSCSSLFSTHVGNNAVKRARCT